MNFLLFIFKGVYVIKLIQRFFEIESAGGILLLFSAVVAMLLANSPIKQPI